MKKRKSFELGVKKYPERKCRTVRLTQNLFLLGYREMDISILTSWI